jgi:hypothetical protein
LCALLAIAAAGVLSSCATFEDRDVAASVNGHEITFDQLATLTDDSTSASVLRDRLETWVRTVAATDSDAELLTVEAMQQALDDVVGAMVAENGAQWREQYELGLDGADYVCVGAIPLTASTDPAEVLAELRAGTTWAAAAEQYSSDPLLAASGGVLYDDFQSADPQGCYPSGSFASTYTPVAALIADEQLRVGVPEAVELETESEPLDLVMVLRSWDDLTIDEQSTVSTTGLQQLFLAKVTEADVYINPRIGRWDASTMAVVAG